MDVDAEGQELDYAVQEQAASSRTVKTGLVEGRRASDA